MQITIFFKFTYQFMYGYKKKKKKIVMQIKWKGKMSPEGVFTYSRLLLSNVKPLKP